METGRWPKKSIKLHKKISTSDKSTNHYQKVKFLKNKQVQQQSFVALPYPWPMHHECPPANSRFFWLALTWRTAGNSLYCGQHVPRFSTNRWRRCLWWKQQQGYDTQNHVCVQTCTKIGINNHHNRNSMKIWNATFSCEHKMFGREDRKLETCSSKNLEKRKTTSMHGGRTVDFHVGHGQLTFDPQRHSLLGRHKHFFAGTLQKETSKTPETISEIIHQF